MTPVALFTVGGKDMAGAVATTFLGNACRPLILDHQLAYATFADRLTRIVQEYLIAGRLPT
jgi:hypothetical protein